jgi:hypothetical protein
MQLASLAFYLFEDSKENNFQQDVLKVYKIEQDDMANCHVGYLPKNAFQKTWCAQVWFHLPSGNQSFMHFRQYVGLRKKPSKLWYGYLSSY